MRVKEIYLEQKKKNRLLEIMHHHIICKGTLTHSFVKQSIKENVKNDIIDAWALIYPFQDCYCLYRQMKVLWVYCGD